MSNNAAIDIFIRARPVNKPYAGFGIIFKITNKSFKQ
jgi:hypothetical protein